MNFRGVRLHRALCLALIFLSALALAAPKSEKTPKPAKSTEPSPWAAWVEPDFPFFSSILDARRTGISDKNLTPRGIVLNLGKDCWVCFDTDLLRVAAVWRGPGVTPKALAPGSYHDPGFNDVAPVPAPLHKTVEIGRASCRERV